MYIQLCSSHVSIHIFVGNDAAVCANTLMLCGKGMAEQTIAWRTADDSRSRCGAPPHRWRNRLKSQLWARPGTVVKSKLSIGDFDWWLFALEPQSIPKQQVTVRHYRRPSYDVLRLHRQSLQKILRNSHLQVRLVSSVPNIFRDSWFFHHRFWSRFNPKHPHTVQSNRHFGQPKGVIDRSNMMQWLEVCNERNLFLTLIFGCDITALNSEGCYGLGLFWFWIVLLCFAFGLEASWSPTTGWLLVLGSTSQNFWKGTVELCHCMPLQHVLLDSLYVHFPFGLTWKAQPAEDAPAREVTYSGFTVRVIRISAWKSRHGSGPSLDSSMFIDIPKQRWIEMDCNRLYQAFPAAFCMVPRTMHQVNQQGDDPASREADCGMGGFGLETVQLKFGLSSIRRGEQSQHKFSPSIG